LVALGAVAVTAQQRRPQQLRLDLGDGSVAPPRIGCGCGDCGIDTIECGEFYMVCDEVWKQAVADPKCFLCIECLERRLGRVLVPADFIECLLNKSPGKSRRMNSRLHGLDAA
jgi:hypothetical protein